MKKQNIIKNLILGTGLLFFISSCDDDIETSSLTLDMDQTATITAHLYAETDQTNLGLENAPDGTKVLVSIDNSYFNPASSGSWVDSATVSNGQIEITVPTNNNGVTVEFIPAEFVANQVQVFGSNSTSISKIFKVPGGSSLGNVKPGESRIHQITYSAEEFENFVEVVSVKFEATANLDMTEAGSELVSQGTIIDFYTTGNDGDGWHATATVGVDGIVELDVPKGKTIHASFVAKVVTHKDPETIRKDYFFNTTTGSFSTSSPASKSLSFGNGQLWE